MRIIFICLLCVSFASCNVEGVKTEKIEDKQKDITSDLDKNIDTSKLNPVDTANRIANIEEIDIDTTSGNEKALATGEKIKWLKKGDGAPLKKGDVIWVNYKSFLSNGRMFDGDQAATQEVPLMVGIGMMVPGVEKSLLELREGDYVKMLIPSEQGYGENGFVNVPPNTDLLYEFFIRRKQNPSPAEQGVKIWTLKEGSGEKYKEGETVKFHYMAYHKNGSLYFDSYRSKKPFDFVLGGDNIMMGLNIAFNTLKKGDIAFVELPSEVAYGKKGLKDLVPSNTDIIYYIRTVE